MARARKNGAPRKVEDPKAAYKRAQAERLSAARVAAGFENAAAFARALGVQPNTVYRIERGEILPSIETLTAWARASNTSADALLGLESNAPSRRSRAEAHA